MNHNRNTQVLMMAVVLLISLACGAVGAAQPTSAPTSTPVDISIPSTATEKPTSTPEPTATPDVAATQRYDDLFSQVQEFKDIGYIPTTDGEYIEMGDFKEEFSQLGYYQAYPYDLILENFVFTGHIKWSTATQTSDTSGCGVLFGQQEDASDYAVFLDKSRIYFSSSTATTYSELGKTRGTGNLNFGNPAEADLSLLVYDNHAYVYVDDEFIGEYTLSQSKPLRGAFGYGVISGTNKDYGTRCEVSNARIWSLKP